MSSVHWAPGQTVFGFRGPVVAFKFIFDSLYLEVVTLVFVSDQSLTESLLVASEKKMARRNVLRVHLYELKNLFHI
jgi:hypothetical protein